MENNITEEIILQPDGKFYKRKSITSYLMTQEEAIQKVKAKPIYQVCPIPVDTDGLTFFSNYAGDNSDSFYLTTEIGQYPFPGASISPNEDEDGNTKYLLCMPRGSDSIPDDIVRLETTPAYQPNKDERLFITVRYTFDDGELRSEDPILFLYDYATGKSYSLNLPNIYDSGRICTGNDWPRMRTGYVKQAVDLHKLQLEHIMTSHANNDLRDRGLEYKHLCFDIEGKHLNPVKPKDGSKRFFQEITNEQILLFTTWINHGQLI